MGTAKILVVDDERMIRWSIQQALGKEGHSVSTVETGEEALAQAADEMPSLVFLDITLPGIDGIEVLRRLKSMDPSVSVVMVTANEDLKTAIEAMRLGAHDYVSKPFDLDRLKVIAQNALDRHELRQEVEFHRKESVKRYGFHRFVGPSSRLREVVEVARKVARSDATTVLLTGESGTGKDLLAQAIHYESRRATRPFIPINCTALPEDLLESELMGHEKGAFTDAKTSKKGLFEIADGGTVFLDEIGDMKPNLQAKLLRFIETKMFRRIGGYRDISVDVRIIAATNQDLEDLVRTGRFREDLYFRLKVIPIRIPSLRERPEDIVPLANHFLSVLGDEFKRKTSSFTPGTISAMASHHWPGNVRELKNAIERGLILKEGDPVDIREYFVAEGEGDGRMEEGAAGEEMREDGTDGEEATSAARATDGGGSPSPLEKQFPLPAEGIILEELEKSLIKQAIDMQGGNQTKAAHMLGLSRDALRYRMKKHGFLE